MRAQNKNPNFERFKNAIEANMNSARYKREFQSSDLKTLVLCALLARLLDSTVTFYLFMRIRFEILSQNGPLRPTSILAQRLKNVVMSFFFQCHNRQPCFFLLIILFVLSAKQGSYEILFFQLFGRILQLNQILSTAKRTL